MRLVLRAVPAPASKATRLVFRAFAPEADALFRFGGGPRETAWLHSILPQILRFAHTQSGHGVKGRSPLAGFRAAALDALAGCVRTRIQSDKAGFPGFASEADALFRFGGGPRETAWLHSILPQILRFAHTQSGHGVKGRSPLAGFRAAALDALTGCARTHIHNIKASCFPVKAGGLFCVWVIYAGFFIQRPVR